MNPYDGCHMSMTPANEQAVNIFVLRRLREFLTKESSLLSSNAQVGLLRVLENDSPLMIGLNAKESEKVKKKFAERLTASSAEDNAPVVNSLLFICGNLRGIKH